MPATDNFQGSSSGIDSPLRKAVAITPDDANETAFVSRGILVGVGGNVAVIMADDTSSVVLPNLIAGVLYPFRVKKILVTGTTATGIFSFA